MRERSVHRTPDGFEYASHEEYTEHTRRYRETVALIARCLGRPFDVQERAVRLSAGSKQRDPRRLFLFPDGNAWPSAYCPGNVFPRGWIQHTAEDMEACRLYAAMNEGQPWAVTLLQRLRFIDAKNREFATVEETREPQNLKGYVCYVDRIEERNAKRQ